MLFERMTILGHPGVKICEVFLCFLAIIFLGSIVLTSHWLLCIDRFTSLVRFTGFYTESEPNFSNGQPEPFERTTIFSNA